MPEQQQTNIITEEQRQTLLNHVMWLEDNFCDGEQEMQAVQIIRELLRTKIHAVTVRNNELWMGEFPIIVRHQEGDIDTISATKPNMAHLISALYDLYQVSDVIKNGDVFSLNGQIIARCVDVHVIPVPSYIMPLDSMLQIDFDGLSPIKYDDYSESPEWNFLESRASFKHTEVDEFIIHVESIGNSHEKFPWIKTIVDEAKSKGVVWILFHLGH